MQLAREELIAQLLAALGPAAAVHDALNGRRRILYPHRPAVDLSMDFPTGQRRIEVTLTIPKRLGVELCDFLRGHAEAQPPPIACRLCQAPHYADELVPASGHCPSCAPEAHHRLRM